MYLFISFMIVLSWWGLYKLYKKLKVWHDHIEANKRCAYEDKHQVVMVFFFIFGGIYTILSFIFALATLIDPIIWLAAFGYTELFFVSKSLSAVGMHP